MAQLILVGGLYLAWRQISVSLQDISIRSKREAGALALEQSKRFAEIIEESVEIVAKMNASGHTLKKISMADFSAEELKKSFPKLESDHNQALGTLSNIQHGTEDATFLINKIDSFAVSFTKKLADEEVIFGSVAQAYCEIIEQWYFLYCFHRDNSQQRWYFDNTVELYKVWRPRLEKNKLLVERSRLDKKIHDIPSTEVITPIGV